MQIQVKCCTESYNGLRSVLTSNILISAAFNPASGSSPDPNTLPKFVAAWDTGATNTVITQKVAQMCGLLPTGMTEVRTAKGKFFTNVYFAAIWLPNKVYVPQLRVTEGILTDIDALIGMDIISQGDFAVSNKNGKTILTFRMPSIESIDFVKQQPPSLTVQSSVSNKVSRNSPCPCGSGKKYKKCCGK